MEEGADNEHEDREAQANSVALLVTLDADMRSALSQALCLLGSVCGDQSLGVPGARRPALDALQTVLPMARQRVQRSIDASVSLVKQLAATSQALMLKGSQLGAQQGGLDGSHSSVAWHLPAGKQGQAMQLELLDLTVRLGKHELPARPLRCFTWTP